MDRTRKTDPARIHAIVLYSDSQQPSSTYAFIAAAVPHALVNLTVMTLVFLEEIQI